VRINSPIGLGVANQLARTSQAISRSLARLGSGKRIVSAQDDPAGMVQSVRLESQIRGNAQAIRNVNDTLGLLQTAEAGMSSQLSILQRLREIAVQASSGLLSSEARASLTTESRSLLEEFERISSSTEFNGIQLLDGNFGTKTFNIGAQANSTVQIGLPSTTASSIFTKMAGTRTFSAATQLGTTTTGKYIAVDVNNDGKQDYFQGKNLFLGHGDGTYSQTVSATTTGSIQDVVDFNGDNIVDLVTVSGGNIGIYYGNGDGTFQAARSFAASSTATSLMVGDVNGDGSYDVLTSDGADQSASIFLNNGNGTFQSRSTLAVGGTNSSLFIRDVNNDGKSDFTVLDTSNNRIKLFLGNGNGTFNLSQCFAPTALTFANYNIGDLNNDGMVDLVYTTNIGGAYLRLGNGTGNFGTDTTMSGSVIQTGRIHLQDLDGDSYLDVIHEDAGAAVSFSVLWNSSGSTFSLQNLPTNTSNTAFNPSFFDYDLDGIVELHYVEDDGISTYSTQQMVAKTRAIAQLDFSTTAKAKTTLGLIDGAISSLSSSRATLAANLNRLSSTEDHLYRMNENLSNALSTLTDVDVAAEVAELTRLQILQQAQVAALGQSNLNMQLVLNLLGNVMG